MRSFDELFRRLEASDFRRRFRLRTSDMKYVSDKGPDVIREHARSFVDKRLAPAYIANDGKQTPMRGHPVFLAQHATACCCRGCLEKWHGIPKGTELTAQQREYVTEVLMAWIEKGMKGYQAPEPESKKQDEQISMEELFGGF